MNLDSVTAKQISEIEQLVSHLIDSMRKAKLHDVPIYATLQEFEKELGETRRQRYDENHSQYSSY